jgi:hypothetical protein
VAEGHAHHVKGRASVATGKLGAVAMDYLIFVALGAVGIVLVLGLLNMMRGGSANTSQKLMRWRVGLQFLAIIVVMTVLYFRNG